MDLKFTFDGAARGSGHGGEGHGADGHSHDEHAPGAGIPLPFSTKPASTGGAVELRVRRSEATLVAEALSGDGVVYASGEAECPDAADAPVDAAALGRTLRSALSRSVAGLEGPLADAVASVTVDFAGAAEALTALGIPVDCAADPSAAVDEALQRRIGIAAGTPIRVA